MSLRPNHCGGFYVLLMYFFFHSEMTLNWEESFYGAFLFSCQCIFINKDWGNINSELSRITFCSPKLYDKELAYYSIEWHVIAKTVTTNTIAFPVGMSDLGFTLSNLGRRPDSSCMPTRRLANPLGMCTIASHGTLRLNLPFYPFVEIGYFYRV